MPAVDERIVTVSLNINGQLKTYASPMYISSTGKICSNPLQSEVVVKLANVSKPDADYLLTQCSPFNKNPNPKILVLQAGRVSTGTNVIFQGNISTCVPSQPPDIILTFKCQANQALKGKIIASQQPPSVALSKIAQQVANDCGLSCNFQATDKNISNYAFTGGALKQVDKLGYYGVNAWVDGSELMVTDLKTPLKGWLRRLDMNSGLIGIPEITEQGIRVKYLLDNTSKVGGSLQLESGVWSALDGFYRIFTLGWEISSREDPFYWIADCERLTGSGAVVVPTNVPKRKGKRK